jgi:plasmid stabilization system protein ParE
MRFAIEFPVESERDFELIFDYLFAAYQRFGDDSNEAFERAADKILAIRRQAQSLAVFFGPQDHVRHMLVRLLRSPDSSGS